MKGIENAGKITLRPQVRNGSNCNEFHESYSCLMTSLGDLLYRISLNSVKKHGKYRSKFIKPLNKMSH